MSDNAFVRFELDMVLPPDASATQVERMKTMLTETAEAQSKEVFGQTLHFTKPATAWHSHDGKKGCGYCDNDKYDQKNADDPTGQN